MMERARSPEAGVLKRLTHWESYTIGDTFAAENAGMQGRLLGDIARERGQTPTDALFDLVIRDELRTVLWPGNRDDSDESWALRARPGRTRDVLLGGSDAGAHLDRMCGSPYPTQFLGRLPARPQAAAGGARRAAHHPGAGPAVRPARARRARARAGPRTWPCSIRRAWARAGRARRGSARPSWRLIARSAGMARVLVNGQPIVEDGESTGRVPGTLLRSGRDTQTVLP